MPSFALGTGDGVVNRPTQSLLSRMWGVTFPRCSMPLPKKIFSKIHTAHAL